MLRAIGRRLSKNTPLLQGAAPLHVHNTPPARNGEGWMLELGKGGRAYASGGRNAGPASSSSSSSGRVGDPFKEKRNLLDTAEELLTPRPELKPKGWDWHAWQLFVATLPGTCILVWGHYANKQYTEDFITIQNQEKAQVAEEKQRQEEDVKRMSEEANERLMSRIDALEQQLEEVRQQQSGREGGQGSGRPWLSWITGGTRKSDGQNRSDGRSATQSDETGGMMAEQSAAAEDTVEKGDNGVKGGAGAATATWWPARLLWRGGAVELGKESVRGSVGASGGNKCEQEDEKAVGTAQGREGGFSNSRMVLEAGRQWLHSVWTRPRPPSEEKTD